MAPDLAAWASALGRPSPVLVHLNADTTWLLQVPRGADAGGRPVQRHFNVLIDPWLSGAQSDVASWFSSQTHVVPAAVATIQELEALLRDVERRRRKQQQQQQQPSGRDEDGGGDQEGEGNMKEERGSEGDEKDSSDSYVDAVVISHEFTDHCHRATLLELPPSVPVIAADAAADLVRTWSHFSSVTTMPGLSASASQHWRSIAGGPLPAWLAVGRLVTPGNSLYYHSAVVVAFDEPERGDGRRQVKGEACSEAEAKTETQANAPCIIYSPHGISAPSLLNLGACALSPLALLHGLHDVRLRPVKQLNLGALNGIRAAQASGARYWIATHDEEKAGKGLIAPLLGRRRYTLEDAVAHEGRRAERDKGNIGKRTQAGGAKGARETKEPGYKFLEMGSGDLVALD